MKVFETIDDRGVGINSMDLLKNLMFMQVSDYQFGLLKDKGKKLGEVLDEAKEKPLPFLRYFILARFGAEAVREEGI